jgi:hypothetical protein
MGAMLVRLEALKQPHQFETMKDCPLVQAAGEKVA